MRQDLIAAGHHRHGDAEFGVGIAELRAGDTGAHDHQVFGQFGEVIELAPVEDSLAVRLGAGQHPGTRAGRDQHHVGLEHTDLAVMGGDLNPVVCHPGHVVDQFGVAGHHSDLLAQQLGADIGGLRAGQGLDAVVDLGERDLGVLDTDVETQARGPAQLGAHPGGGDEGLGRHAVEEHAGPADTVGIHHGHLGDLGPVAGRHQSGLITGRSPADDHDPRLHALI